MAAVNFTLTDQQTEDAIKELVHKYPKIERLAVDPPIANQNIGLFSFKLLPKPVNGVYGFLKFRGAFNTEDDYLKHCRYIIRTIDSKHAIWPYEQGQWMPITTNEEFCKEVLSVTEKDEITDIFNEKEKDEKQKERKKVKEIEQRTKKLIEESQRKELDKASLDYYAQQIMKRQQIEGWLEQLRQRKRDLLKGLHVTQEEIERLDKEMPEFKDKVAEKIKQIKAEIGLDDDAPLDRPSISTSLV